VIGFLYIILQTVFTVFGQRGVNPTLMLVGNSYGMELESREVGTARLGKRRPVCPGGDSQEVNCLRRDDVLQAGFGKALVAGAA
jgi:hypothetical protein